MLIPIVVGAIILGRAFDITTMKDRSVYIFDTNVVKANEIHVPRTFIESQYRLTSSSSEVNDFLNIDGELSIKAKKGDINLQGYGSYLLQTVDRENTVEVLITVYHETQTDTFPSYLPVRTDWQKKPTSEVGTHYIRSITYGGQLIISYQLRATKSEYLEEIKAAVTANLAVSGSIDLNAKGNFDKLSKQVGSKSSAQIYAYATTGAISVPQNLDQVFKLVDEYPSMVKKLNEGKGSPLKIDLVDLNTLSVNHSDYQKNFALDAMLNEATNKYDDVRVSSEKYRAWEKEGGIWTPEQQKLIDAYYRKLKNAETKFRAAITALDGAGGLDQFDEAFKAYGENGENIPNKYARELTLLQHTVMKLPFYWFPYTKAVSHYIHWGSVNCTLPSPQPVFIGLAGTAPVGFGNGGNVECLNAIDPDLEEKKLSSGTAVSHINGLTYELPDKSKGPVLCSFCRLENATTAFTIVGRKQCPAEMKLEYSGHLMTSKDAGTASAFICLNKTPDTKIPKVEIKPDSTAASLKPVWMICPDCDKDEDQKYISCVVCSR